MIQNYREKRLRLVVRSFASALTVAAILAMTTVGAIAQNYKVGALEITRVWSRATPGGARVAAGYLTITNTGKQTDRLVGITTDVAKRVSVHTMTMVKGVMRMRRLKGGLEIKPAETVKLRPGAYHLMLKGLRQPLKKGDAFKAMLKFQNAGEVQVVFDVAGIAAKAPGNERAHERRQGRGSGGMMNHNAPGRKNIK